MTDYFGKNKRTHPNFKTITCVAFWMLLKRNRKPIRWPPLNAGTTIQ